MRALQLARRFAPGAVDRYTLRKADVAVVSFPKAGRTWLRMLVGQALAGHFDLDGVAAEEVLQVTRLAAGRGVPRVLFTHDGNPQGSTPAEIRARSKRPYRATNVVLLARDPRDVAVSLYFQKAKRKQLQGATARTGASIDEFVRSDRGGVDSVVAFYAHWLEHRGTPLSLTVVRYEDLHADPGRVLRRVLGVAGVHDVDQAVVDRAVAAGRFDTMRSLERSGRLQSEALRPGAADDEESYKTRRGEVGGYRDYVDSATQEWMAGRLLALPAELGYR